MEHINKNMNNYKKKKLTKKYGTMTAKEILKTLMKISTNI